MAAPSGGVNAGLQTSYQALVDAVKRKEDSAAMQILNDTAQQLGALNQHQVQAVKTAEQLQIQDTITTLGQLLDLQRQLDDDVVKDLSTKLNTLKINATQYEQALSKKAALTQDQIDLLTQQNADLKARIAANMNN